MKKNYKTEMAAQIVKLPVFTKISVNYVLYPKTKRLCDISNVCCIVDKFFMDTLVDMGKLKDDNYLLVPTVSYAIGSVDKDNPRCEIFITEI